MDAVLHSDRYNSTEVIALYVELLDKPVRQSPGPNRRPSPDPRVERLLSILTASFADPELNLAAAMDSCAPCRGYLRRLFKEATGLSPRSYLTALRLSCAKKLLREGVLQRRSISEISALSGYYDSGYFARVFKKSIGVTPREYAAQESGIDTGLPTGAELVTSR